MIGTHHQFGTPELLTSTLLGQFYPYDLIIAYWFLRFFIGQSNHSCFFSSNVHNFLIQNKINYSPPWKDAIMGVIFQLKKQTLVSVSPFSSDCIQHAGYSSYHGNDHNSQRFRGC